MTAAETKKAFAASILAVERAAGNFRHTCFWVEAVNQNEATGLALSIARKLFPKADGWSDHDVVIKPLSDAPSTVETAIIVE